MKPWQVASLVLIAALFEMWPLPHSISMRDLLLALNLSDVEATWRRASARV